jgi:hypothetical protein
MTTSEAERVLQGEGVLPSEYRILKQPSENTWCITRQGRVWLVFYFERGARWNLQRFKDESAACDYFVCQILGFPVR